MEDKIKIVYNWLKHNGYQSVELDKANDIVIADNGKDKIMIHVSNFEIISSNQKRKHKQAFNFIDRAKKYESTLWEAKVVKDEDYISWNKIEEEKV